MLSMSKTLCASAWLFLSFTIVLAQDTPPTSQGIATEGDMTETTDFRTFEATEQEREIFRSSGNITHQGGEAVYNATCAGCHMTDGAGAVGAGMYPALANNDLLAQPDYPVYVILEGQKAMPPFGGMLDDQQVADVVNYIRSSFGNDFVSEFGEATAEQVGETRQ